MAEKTFTQEEVNTIVQDRLAKEKAKYEKQLSDLQADITRREKRMEAREKLQEKGLPVELADLVRLDDDQSFSTSLELLERTYKQQAGPAGPLSGSGCASGAAAPAQMPHSIYSPAGGSCAHPDPVREAMGLKG